MVLRKTTLERAFEIARSGQCESIQALRTLLKAEGFAHQQIAGPSLMRQLRELLARSKSAALADGGERLTAS